MAGIELGTSGRWCNIQQTLVQHVFHCSNHECIIPLCVNTKLMMKHSQVCKKENCKICQEMNSLASKHSETCVDHSCRVPFCAEANSTDQADAQIDLSDFLDAIIEDNTPRGPHNQSTNELDSTNGGFQTRSVSSVLDAPSNNDALMQMFPPLSTAMCDRSRVAPDPLPPGSVLFPKQNTLLKMSPTLLDIGINECPSVAASETFNHSSSFKNPSLFSKSSSLKQQNGGPLQVSMTTKSRVATSRLSVQGLEDAGLQQKGFADRQSCSINLKSSEQEKVPQSQQRNRNRNKNHGESIHQMSMGDHVKSLMACPNYSSIMGREDDVTSSQSILLKVRFMDSLNSIMQLILRTKTKRELLICFNSLRNALQESKRFRIRSKNHKRTLLKS